MTVQVASHNFSPIGRMFARQNAPAIYSRQKTATAGNIDTAAQAVDNVDLSPFAPKPLSGDLFSEAMETAKIMNDGGKLSNERVEKLREDRVFSAVSALAAMGVEGDDNRLPRSWPTGLPSPSREELEEARRRLAQRLQHEETATEPQESQKERVDLLGKIRNYDFSAFTHAEPT